tara:strand:- start:4569 stop:4904 length:336 start_codon:yes stop_codon:yes gene_type:complete
MKLMIKIKILLIIVISTLFLNACNTLKDGFRSQKKDSIDEFLVEKKSPLIMPPDFDELPLPNENNQNLENAKETDIKSLISNNENSSSKTQNNSNQNKNFENSILEKIKKN